MADPVIPWERERDGPFEGKVLGFMCLTDLEFELGAAMGGCRIFPSIEDAKENLKCWSGCGIVKVAVEYVSTEIEGTNP